MPPEGQSCASRPPSGTEARQARAAGQTHRPRPRRSSDAQPGQPRRSGVLGRHRVRLSAVAHSCSPFVRVRPPGSSGPGRTRPVLVPAVRVLSGSVPPGKPELRGRSTKDRAERVSAAPVGLHPRFTPTEVDTLGAAGGLAGRRGSTGHTRTPGPGTLRGANPSAARPPTSSEGGPHPASQVGILSAFRCAKQPPAQRPLQTAWSGRNAPDLRPSLPLRAQPLRLLEPEHEYRLL